MSQVSERPAATGATGQLVFVDALRVAVIVMVIVHHAAQAYGPTGEGWPVTDPLAQSHWFRPFYTVNAAIGLGLLFLLAGYLLPGAYERKGRRSFLRERWARIGVPLLAFALGLHLPILYLVENRPPLGEFVAEIYEGGWISIYLHLWFLGHLLLYTAAYVVWRAVSGRVPWRRVAWPPPGHVAIAGFVLVLALATWVVRGWFSVDEWVPMLFVLAAEPARLPQYVALFALGIMAYRGDWLRRIPMSVGVVWLGVGLAASIGVVAAQELLPDRWDGYLELERGGANWPSLLRSALEALVCAGLGVGVLVLFREAVRRPSRLLTMMASASYAAYILHLYLVVALQSVAVDLRLPVFVKFALVAVVGVALSFGLGHLSRRVPGARVLLGTAGKQAGPSSRRALAV